MKMHATKNDLIQPDKKAIRCAQCNLPSLEIRAGGLLVVRNKHHGQTHENSFSLAWIKQLIEQAEASLIQSGAQQ